jgi:adenylosuccinate synthase
LDTLNYFDEVLICDHYVIDGEKVFDLPMDRDKLGKAEPHYLKLNGWRGQDINGIREKRKLPPQVLDFIDVIEKHVGIDVEYISVGRNKEEMIENVKQFSVESLLGVVRQDIAAR